MDEREFQINEYLKLKLEGKNTVIYVGGKRFRQCKYLLIDEIKGEDISDYQNQAELLIEEMQHASIDEKAKQYSKVLEANKEKISYLHILPSEEFWAHCSNLEVWAENEYDTCLLHSNLSFPLLKKLSDLGDKIAKIRLKEEICKRYKNGAWRLQHYLIHEGYISTLNQEELINGVLNVEDALVITKISEITNMNYSVITDFDSLREDRKKGYYYFTVRNGFILDLEIVLNSKINYIPKILTKLKKLQMLFVYIESITNKLIEFKPILNSLVRLEIFTNESVILHDEFDKFPNLFYLSIQSSRYGHEIISFVAPPKTLGSLEKLQFLTLSDVDLKKLPDTIGNLKILKNLYLSSPTIEKLPNSIYSLQKLETLTIDSRNFDLTLLKKKWFKKIKYLSL